MKSAADLVDLEMGQGGIKVGRPLNSYVSRNAHALLKMPSPLSSLDPIYDQIIPLPKNDSLPKSKAAATMAENKERNGIGRKGGTVP